MRRSRQTLATVLISAVVLVIWGCSPNTVQEDRSINYSAEGNGVAFQHGEEGVFIASPDGQSLQQIHDASDALAVSSPLWSPIDQRLVFTTAHPAETEGAEVPQPIAAWDANPEGRRFLPQQVVYTCWMRKAASDGQPPEPSAIFTARCDHPGYVAANLAVRWHPNGKKILFLDQDQQGGVSLFEFDLRSKSKRRLIEHRANALIFDWSPNHSYLTCSLFGAQGDPGRDGIWLRAAQDSQWWQVPDSDLRVPRKHVQRLDLLRKSRPAWTADDEQFAFLSLEEADDGRQVRTIFQATPESQTVARLHESDSVIRDLRWQTNSRRLGFVEGTPGSLRIIDPAGEVSDPINPFAIRRFVGWNHDGSKLAFVSPEPIDEKQSEWTFLFPAIAGARDRVYVADEQTGEAARLVHRDVRITFPQWSPNEDELSLWGTYAPTHASLLSAILPWSLRPGDPAAILDAATGQMRWMAVNRHEQSQVGHYYLLKRDYEQAWQWYEKAAENRPPPEPIQLADFAQLMRQRRIYQNPMFFEYYCLHKLGRDSKAERRLTAFRRSMTLEWEEADLESLRLDLRDPEAKAQLAQVVAFLTPVLQSVYMTEVFLSLDAAGDGIKFFKQQTAAAETDAERFASLVCLSQLLLANGAHQEYADLVTHQLAPLFNRMNDSASFLFGGGTVEPGDWSRWAQGAVVTTGVGLAGLPMASPEFMQKLPEGQVQRCLTDWEAFRENVTGDELRLAADLVIHALLVRLDDDRQQELRERIAESQVALAPNGEQDRLEIEKVIQQVREFSSFVTALR